MRGAHETHHVQAPKHISVSIQILLEWYLAVNFSQNKPTVTGSPIRSKTTVSEAAGRSKVFLVRHIFVGRKPLQLHEVSCPLIHLWFAGKKREKIKKQNSSPRKIDKNRRAPEKKLQHATRMLMCGIFSPCFFTCPFPSSHDNAICMTPEARSSTS
jgi:hypothetical protein